MVGNFPDVSFPDLIQFYCMSKKTVAIRVSTPDLPEGRGEFFVADGELLDARFGERVGVDALTARSTSAAAPSRWKST